MDNNNLIFHYSQDGFINNLKQKVVYSTACDNCLINCFLIIKKAYTSRIKACSGIRVPTAEEYFFVTQVRTGLDTISDHIACEDVAKAYINKQLIDCGILAIVHNLMNR